MCGSEGSGGDAGAGVYLEQYDGRNARHKQPPHGEGKFAYYW